MSDPSDFEKIDAEGTDRDHNAESEAKAKLEAELIATREQLKVERICSMIVVIIFFDVIVFRDLNNWGSSIAILTLELIVIYLLGQCFKIDHVPQLFDKAIQAIKSNRSNS